MHGGGSTQEAGISLVHFGLQTHNSQKCGPRNHTHVPQAGTRHATV